ncbi:hypothetical protein NPIL_421161, partial [Nephila pilipes]
MTSEEEMSPKSGRWRGGISCEIPFKVCNKRLGSRGNGVGLPEEWNTPFSKGKKSNFVLPFQSQLLSLRAGLKKTLFSFVND